MTVFVVPDEGPSQVKKFAQYIWPVLILLVLLEVSMTYILNIWNTNISI
jgi:hypothetical protein